MKYMKIRFTEWRDAAASGTIKESPELLAANDQLAALDKRERGLFADAAQVQSIAKIADDQQLRDAQQATAAELANIRTARKAVLAAQDAAAAAAAGDMKAHRKVGTFGYQVITDDGTLVTGLVDEGGAPLDAAAVYGYEIVDVAPATPAWAPKGIA